MRFTIEGENTTMATTDFHQLRAQADPAHISLKMAQDACNRCCGVEGPDLSLMDESNVMQVRKYFSIALINLSKRTHEDIITVLRYMSRFIHPNVSKHEDFAALLMTSN